MTDTKREAPASLEKRAAALEIVLRRKADMPKNFVAEFTEHADDAWITANGAQMVPCGSCATSSGLQLALRHVVNR
jgi:hypothetical protein